MRAQCIPGGARRVRQDRKSTRLNSSHTVIYTLSLHDALPIFRSATLTYSLGARCWLLIWLPDASAVHSWRCSARPARSEEHTSELQSHSDLHSFPTRRSSDLQERDADLFFGREVLVADLVARCERSAFLAVLGASG